MKVAVYVPDYNKTHQEILESFAEGIPGAVVRHLSEFDTDTDAAVVFGWFKYAYSPTMEKKQIIHHYFARQSLIVIESAFMKRKEYYQIGWNGFAGFADFKNRDVPLDRWNAMDIPVKPWTKRKDGLIVICGQLPRDTQVQDVDHLAWCRETFEWYQAKYGARVVFRPHPRIGDPLDYGIDAEFINDRALSQVLPEASLVVTWNSTTGVEAIVSGVPVVACNAGSMAHPMASRTYEEKPVYPDRTGWLAGIGYAQWTPDEMKRGLPWKHLTQSKKEGMIHA